MLSYLDFFPIGVQRVAVNTAANMCRAVPTDGTGFSMVQDIIPNLTNLLSHHDQRIVEGGCSCFISLAESLGSNPSQLESLNSHALMEHLLRLLSGAEASRLEEPGLQIAPSVSLSTFSGLVKLLAVLAGGCPSLRSSLLAMGIANVLAAMLSPHSSSSALGASPACGPSSTSTVGSPSSFGSSFSGSSFCKSGSQLVVVLSLVSALLPKISLDGALSALSESVESARTCGATSSFTCPDDQEAGLRDNLNHNASMMCVDVESAEAQAGVTKLGQQLFSLLVSVCTSTQTASVKHKSLLALNKFVSAMAIEDLQRLLQPQCHIVSRFLGDLLGSSSGDVIV
eukprot:SAG11_NODE_1713_length_4398_cov_5.942080_1_plen_340_part_10